MLTEPVMFSLESPKSAPAQSTDATFHLDITLSSSSGDVLWRYLESIKAGTLVNVVIETSGNLSRVRAHFQKQYSPEKTPYFIL